MTSSENQIEQMDRQVEAEFLEEVKDILAGLNVLVGNLRSHSLPAAEGLNRIRREMLNVAIRGATLDQPLVTIIAHRLGEYVTDLGELDPLKLDDIQTFLDQIRHALDGKLDQSSAAGAKIVRTLPVRISSTFNPADVKVSNVEILLVVPDKAMGRIIERELHACGYRVSNVTSPYQALQTIMRAQPDMVIVSGVLEELSGVDLAAALSAMPSTRNLPVAILTSFSWGHPSLQDLPSRVPVIRKGANFGDDLAEALSRLRIT